MHTQTSKEDDKHRSPHIILHESVTETIHFATISKDGIEKRAKNGEHKGNCNQDTERVHVVLIDRLGKPAFHEIIDQNANPCTCHSVYC